MRRKGCYCQTGKTGGRTMLEKGLEALAGKTRFDLSHWLLNQKANYYVWMADRAVRRYKRKVRG